MIILLYDDNAICAQVRSGSEKGWDSLQSYIKRIGQIEDNTDGTQEDGGRGEGNGARDGYGDNLRREEGGEVECDVGDLLGFQDNSSGNAQHMDGKWDEEVHKKHGKKKRQKKVEDASPSLISFDDDSVCPTTSSSNTTSISLSLSATAEASSKSRTQENKSCEGGERGGGYGSIANKAAVGSTIAKDDLLGNWDEEEWCGGSIATTPPVSGGGWDEDWGEGWSSVDLRSKTD